MCLNYWRVFKLLACYLGLMNDGFESVASRCGAKFYHKVLFLVTRDDISEKEVAARLKTRAN